MHAYLIDLLFSIEKWSTSVRRGMLNRQLAKSGKKGAPYAVYLGPQRSADIELFLVFGDHPLHGSSVGRKTLEREKIEIRRKF